MKKKIPIVVATIHPWNIASARKWRAPHRYKKILITKREYLTPTRLKRINPRYIFFPHWSWIIPEEIWKNHECIVFHMTDLPFGRGGSPLQNLISRGIYKTKVSAIRVEAGIDTGAVYLKHSFDLRKGSAETLYTELAGIVFKMMSKIIKETPRAIPQHGKAVVFSRRTPADSVIPKGLSLRQLFDFVRMLDAPEYPRAFLESDGTRFEFHSAKLCGKRLTLSVDIRKYL